MAVGITEHGWTTSAWLPYRVSAACLEPWRAIKYLSHIGVSFITAVEGHYRTQGYMQKGIVTGRSRESIGGYELFDHTGC